MVGLEEITNILNKYLEKFELTAKADTDFAYYPDDNLITYALVVSERMNEMFMKAVNSISKDIKADIFLLSLMHEIGHHETWDLLEDEEIEESEIIKECAAVDDSVNEAYYFAPDEYAATSWGVNYILEHQAEVASLWEELQPAILKFYEINNIH